MRSGEWFRGEIPYADPLQRARMAGDLEDARQERQRELSRYEAAERGEAYRAQREAQDRVERASRGYTSAELAEWQRQRDDRKAERIAELNEELDRLDPSRRRGQARRSDVQAESRERLLARATARTISCGIRSASLTGGSLGPAAMRRSPARSCWLAGVYGAFTARRNVKTRARETHRRAFPAPVG